MKKIVLALSAAAIAVLVIAGTARGQISPPPPPGGGATATPTVTPSPVPTATSVPLTLRESLSSARVKARHSQKVSVATLPGTSVTVSVKFPNGQKDGISAAAGSSGSLTYQFVQPGGVTKGKNHTVAVSVKASLGTQSKSSTKKYTIA